MPVIDENTIRQFSVLLEDLLVLRESGLSWNSSYKQLSSNKGRIHIGHISKSVLLRLGLLDVDQLPVDEVGHSEHLVGDGDVREGDEAETAGPIYKLVFFNFEFFLGGKTYSWLYPTSARSPRSFQTSGSVPAA